ncbi:hypothetical protein DYH09_33725, partial [bacterium CPR1]|nr:hypothetical protein [bacterium CPR1]
MSNQERNSLLLKASQSKLGAPLSARHDDQDPRSHLYQLTVASQENHPTLAYSTVRLLGDSPPFVGYTPEQVFGRTTHNGIGPLGVRFTESGSHRVTITWTFPDGEQPSIVAVQPLSNLPGPDIGLSFPVATEELVMDMDLQVTLGNPGTIAGLISVNGRPLLDLATGSYANTGPQDASLMLMPLTPYHAKYFAYELTKRCPSDSIEKLAGAVASAQVDLNP